jgi:hypothetical protein
MKVVALIAGLLSALAGVVSTLCLMKGAAVVPWEMQTFSGQSDPEKAFREKARLYLRIGHFTLAGAFVLAAAAALAGYLS